MFIVSLSAVVIGWVSEVVMRKVGLYTSMTLGEMSEYNPVTLG